jgi:hypothetical protein
VIYGDEWKFFGIIKEIEIKNDYGNFVEECLLHLS